MVVRSPSKLLLTFTLICFAHKLHYSSRIFVTNAVRETAMLELTLIRKAKEETSDSPGEIHCLDIHGIIISSPKKMGSSFMKERWITTFLEVASQYGTDLQNLTAQDATRIHP